MNKKIVKLIIGSVVLIAVIVAVVLVYARIKDVYKRQGVDCSSGSLGHGLSLACGFALAGRVNGIDYICLLYTSRCV